MALCVTNSQDRSLKACDSTYQSTVGEDPASRGGCLSCRKWTGQAPKAPSGKRPELCANARRCLAHCLWASTPSLLCDCRFCPSLDDASSRTESRGQKAAPAGPRQTSVSSSAGVGNGLVLKGKTRNTEASSVQGQRAGPHGISLSLLRAPEPVAATDGIICDLHGLCAWLV